MKGGLSIVLIGTSPETQSDRVRGIKRPLYVSEVT